MSYSAAAAGGFAQSSSLTEANRNSFRRIFAQAESLTESRLVRLS